ncbi:MAG: cytochrome-c peroxidase [Gemmatimonadetes bacterium]|nr:cytochrome-c peroxidase [Gemmatimonadota bacterium]
MWSLGKSLPLAALVGVSVLAGCGGDPSGPPVPDYPAPDPATVDTQGLFAMPETPENPLTVQGIALGRKLFHDPILSGDSTQSCATCHNQAFAFSDNGRQFSVGITGATGTRNAPALINMAWNPNFFWAGRAPSLEDQAREPVPNPIEMNIPWGAALDRLRAHADYPDLFGHAFGSDEVTQNRVVMAISQFERTLISNNSRWDQKQRGEIEFTPEEAAGERLFFLNEPGADCFHCHRSALFTDNRMHDNGLDVNPNDAGHSLVSGQSFDFGKMRSPTLRNIEYTAPYMHDGRFATLEEVIDHYSEGLQQSPNLDPLLSRRGAGAGFTDQEKAELLAFLKTLSDPSFLTNPAYGPPTD